MIAGVEPPDFAGVRTEQSAPLTYKTWTVPVALLLTVLTTGIAVAGGVASKLVSASGLLRTSDKNADALVLGLVLSAAYAVVLLTVVGAARRSRVPFSHAVGLRSTQVGAAVLAGVVIALAARFIAAGYALLLQSLGGKVLEGIADPTRLLPLSVTGVVMTLLVACVIGPIVEEIVFRGVLLSALRDRWGDGVAITGSSVIFALAHGTPYAMPPLFVLSVLMGRQFIKSRSLWTPIAAHAMFNTIGIGGLYLLRWIGVT